MVKSSMNGVIRNDVADGRVGSEGGLRPSALSTGHNGVASGPLAPGQRWSVSRKREVVLRLLRGEAAEDLSRELGVPLYKLERWRRKAEGVVRLARRLSDGSLRAMNLPLNPYRGFRFPREII